MQHRLAIALFALCTPAGWSANEVEELLPAPQTLDYTRPLTGGDSTIYTRGLAGDFDGDSLQDIVYLHGDQAEVVFAPGLFMALWDNVATANDIGVLEAGAGAADSVLSVGSGGLKERQLAWNGSTPLWLTVLLESGWAGAKRVASHTRHLPAGAQSWVFGLQANQRTVRGRAKGSNTGWMEGQLFTTSFDVNEILPIDFMGDGEIELAVCGNHRFEIWKRNTLPLAPWVKIVSVLYPQYDLLGMAAGSQGAGTNQWLALLAAPIGAPTDSTLLVHDLGGALPPETLAGSPDAAGIAAGDFDDDGDDDLVISIRDSFDVLVALNQGAADPDFDGTRGGGAAPTRDIAIPGVSNDPATTEAQPIVADFDNDDFVDFCLPIQATDALFVHRDRLAGPGVPESGFDVLASSIDGVAVHDEDYATGAGGSACSTSELLLPTVSGAFPGQAELIESHLWIHRDLATYAEPDSLNYLGLLEGTGTTPYDLDLDLDSNPGDLPNSTDQDPTIYYFLLCYAERDPTTNEVTRILRPRLYGFQTLCEFDADPACQAMADLASLQLGDAFPVSAVPCDGPTPPGIWIGGGVPLPCIPQLPPASPPRMMRQSL